MTSGSQPFGRLVAYGHPRHLDIEKDPQMKPELEAELRATVASLRIKVSCHELLLLALLPGLAENQKSPLRERLSDMEQAEVMASTFVDQNQAETETMGWIRAMREALDS